MHLALVLVSLVLLMSGCSIALDERIYEGSGKFSLLDCPSLAQSIQKASAREAEVTGLIDRAAEGAEGQVLDTLAYQAELNTVRTQLQALRKTADDKHCPPIISRQLNAVEPAH